MVRGVRMRGTDDKYGVVVLALEDAAFFLGGMVNR